MSRRQFVVFAMQHLFMVCSSSELALNIVYCFELKPKAFRRLRASEVGTRMKVVFAVHLSNCVEQTVDVRSLCWAKPHPAGGLREIIIVKTNIGRILFHTTVFLWVAFVYIVSRVSLPYADYIRSHEVRLPDICVISYARRGAVGPTISKCRRRRETRCLKIVLSYVW